MLFWNKAGCSAVLVGGAALWGMSTYSSAAQTGRFAPDNPWYREFEATCRQDDPGNPMHPECRKGVEAAWREFSGSENIKCGYGAYWLVSDEKKRQAPETFEVLPWQYGVEAVLQEGGVCRVLAD